MTNHVGIREALDTHLTCDCDLLIVEVDEIIGSIIVFSWRPSRLCIHLTRTVLLDGAFTTSNRACGINVGSRPDGLLLGGHKRIIRVVLSSIPPCLTRWNELDVVFLCSADVSHCLLSKLYSSLAVLLDYITAHVRVALRSLNYDAIVPARVNDVLPDFGRAVLGTTCTSDLDAISVAPFDFIFDQMRLVVIDLYANLIQVERISNNLQKRK